MELAAQAHHSNAELRARYNLAGRLFSDDPRAGTEVIRGAVELATRTGRRDWQEMCVVFLAMFEETLGEWDEAVATAATVVGTSGTAHEADALAVRAAIEARRGDPDAWPRTSTVLRTMLASDSDTQRAGTETWYVTSVAIAEGRLADAIVESSRVTEGNWPDHACFLRGLRAAIRAADLAVCAVGHQRRRLR